MYLYFALAMIPLQVMYCKQSLETLDVASGSTQVISVRIEAARIERKVGRMVAAVFNLSASPFAVFRAVLATLVIEVQVF
jgi:hypothetical protein